MEYFVNKILKYTFAIIHLKYFALRGWLMSLGSPDFYSLLYYASLTG